MSNKKKTLKRQVKTPSQDSDFVVGNMSKKRNDTGGKGSDGSSNDKSEGINIETEMSNASREEGFLNQKQNKLTCG